MNLPRCFPSLCWTSVAYPTQALKSTVRFLSLVPRQGRSRSWMDPFSRGLWQGTGQTFVATGRATVPCQGKAMPCGSPACWRVSQGWPVMERSLTRWFLPIGLRSLWTPRAHPLRCSAPSCPPSPALLLTPQSIFRCGRRVRPWGHHRPHPAAMPSPPARRERLELGRGVFWPHKASPALAISAMGLGLTP